MASNQQLHRLGETLTRLAGAGVQVEEIGGTYYAFGSELATLRLYRKYNAVAIAPGTNQGYSANLDKFYFSISPAQ